jgi:putative phosphoribosyl transferase
MFQDRWQAGKRLGAELARFAGDPTLLVMGLPRGGVPVARAVADALGAELDACLVRKLGVPWQPELALGALAEGDVRVLDERLMEQCGLTVTDLEPMVEEARAELERRSRLYRGPRPGAEVRGRVVIVVDDGLATGSTMLAAVRALRTKGARRIVVAVPVGPPSTCDRLAEEADEVVCLEMREPFFSVGAWYDDFTQIGDLQVQEALSASPARK